MHVRVHPAVYSKKGLESVLHSCAMSQWFGDWLSLSTRQFRNREYALVWGWSQVVSNFGGSRWRDNADTSEQFVKVVE